MDRGMHPQQLEPVPRCGFPPPPVLRDKATLLPAADAAKAHSSSNVERLQPSGRQDRTTVSWYRRALAYGASLFVRRGAGADQRSSARLGVKVRQDPLAKPRRDLLRLPP